jgi:hypothetical protein
MRYKFRPTIGIRTVLLSQRLWKSLSELILMLQVWQKSDSNIKAGSDIFDGPA